MPRSARVRLARQLFSLSAAAAAIAGAGCNCGSQGLRKQTPQIIVSPPSLAVQWLPVGKTALYILQVTNTGTVDLHLTEAPAISDLDGDGSDGELTLASVLDHDCQGARRAAADRLTLAPGVCARLVVQHAPANADADSGEIKIVSDDPDRPVLHVPIGMGDAPRLSLCALDEQGKQLACDSAAGAAPTVPFGHGTASAPVTRKLRLRNDGKIALDIASVQPPEGADRRDFTADASAVPARLAPGASADVTLKFQPSGGGARSAWIEVDSGDPLRPAAQVPLQGQGDGPALCADPAPLDFGTVNLGSSADKHLTLTSCGTAPVQLQTVRFDSLSSVAFTAATLPPPQTLAVGATLDVTVRFRPDTAGPTSGALLIPTADSPDAFVLLQGSGAEVPICRLDSSPTTVDFGQVVRGQTAQRTVTLANRGKLDCHLSAVAITAGSSYFTVTDPLQAPVALRPGDVITFTLQYNPPSTDANASDSGTATAASDDPVRPALDLQLVGSAVAAPVCKLQITPTSGGFFSGRTLQFGNVTVGKSKTLPITLKNAGSANCQLQSYTFATTNLGSSCGQKSCQGYSVVQPLPAGIIAPGQQTQINVQFAPTDTNQIPLLPTVYLFAQTSDQAIQPECTSAFPPNGNNGCVQVGMAGQGVISNLAVIPSDLDFGVVTLGCRSRTETVTIYNTGTASFTIKSFKVDGPNLGSFSLVAPPTPFSIAGGGKQTIQVTYKPSQAAPEAATLYIESDASNTTSNNPYVTVALSGSGTSDKHQKDAFTQQARPTVDLLVIMDNSGSFDQYQTKLAGQAQNFINQALTYQADYHLGVTTNEADHTDTADKNASYPGAQIYVGGLYGQPGILANDTPDVVNAFSKNVKVGTCCSSDREAGLEAAWRALSAPATQNAPPQGSKGFLRDEARLVMLNVTDEEDQSNGTTDFYVDFFTSLKGRYNAGLVSFNTLGGGADGCDENGVSAPAMPRYVDVANRTGGKNFLLCSADWGQVATQLSLDAFAGRVQFPLSRPADPRTLSVTLNGAAQTTPANYSFDQPTNSVVFTVVPPPSSTIVAEYDAVCF